MTRVLLGTLRNAAAVPSILGALITLSFFTSLARADQMEWSQKAGGGGGPIQTTATCGTSVACTAADGSSNRLHSAVLQSSTVLNAASGSWNLTSGYLTTFPPRPLVKCRTADPVDCVGGGWHNDTAFDFRNDRSCATPPCAFSKGALHYYKYVFNTTATATEAAVDAGTKWSDTALYCPGGACDKTGTTVNQAIGGETSTGYYIHVNTYNGGMKGGRETYGPFKIDQTLPTVSWTSPSAGDWFPSTGIALTTSDTDIAGAANSGIASSSMRVVSIALQTVPWSDGNRAINGGTVTVGAGLNCRDRGKNKCSVEVQTKDTAGNYSVTVGPRTFSVDWLIEFYTNAVYGAGGADKGVQGFPVSATNESGAYLGTYVAAFTDATETVPEVDLLDRGTAASKLIAVTSRYALTNALCGGSACGKIVGAPFWTYEAGTPYTYYVYVTTANGWIFKLQNNAGTLVIAPPAANGDWPVRILDKCTGATSRSITTEPFVDDKLVYFGASEAGGTCGTGQQFIFGIEINPTAYNADGGGDNDPDEIVAVPGCGTTSKSGPTVKGSWPTGKYLHIGGDCSAKEVYRVKVDANNADCWRNLAGISSVEGWMTGSFGKLFFGTASSDVALRFYAINNTESTAFCNDPPVASTDPYADVTGFPYLHGGAAITRGAKVNWPSTADEVYFVDDNGSLYCVCQVDGVQCSADPDTTDTGEACAGFPVALDAGKKLREPLNDNGRLYVVSDSGKVFAVETLYDPSCGATNCDGTPGGAQVGSPTYPFDLGTGGTGEITSTTGLRNDPSFTSYEKRIAVGTNSGRTLYLPLVADP